MRLENTDRFRNKFCRVHFKNGAFSEGTIIYIPVSSAKYDFHSTGWFLTTPGFVDKKLSFKDIADIEVFE